MEESALIKERGIYLLVLKRIGSIAVGFLFMMVFVFGVISAAQTDQYLILAFEIIFFLLIFTRRMWSKWEKSRWLDLSALLCFTVVFGYGTFILIHHGHVWLSTIAAVLYLALVVWQTWKQRF